MADVLLVGSDASEIEHLGAFGQSYGKEYDLICLHEKAPEDLGAATAYVVSLPSAPVGGALANGLVEFARGYNVVAGLATMFGKDWLPRLAGLLDRPMVSDVVEVKGAKTFSRPMFAGNVITDVEVASEQFVLSIRGTAFMKPQRGGRSKSEELALKIPELAVRTGISETQAARPDLSQARVVVSGGRPLKDAETFERLIGGLADALGGAAGATRAAVDSGIAPNDLQVGQTGKIVAPDLYIAAGVSGSTQHIAGMKDSKVIVAINTDPDAPIFEIADYGLVQDLFVAIPELMQKLRA